MLMPLVIYVLLFSYAPMFGIILAFKNYVYSKGILRSSWNGLTNFKVIFQTGQGWAVTYHTVLYNLAFMTVNLVLAVIMAILLSEVRGRKFKKISQTMFLMPFFVSWVTVSAIAFNLLNTDTGAINSLLSAMGLTRYSFYNTPHFWPFLMVFFNAWKNVGYYMIIFLAAISGIDQEIYEAAEIDGASVFQRIRSITLPFLKSTAIILVLLQLGRVAFGDTSMFWNLTGNNPLLNPVTDIIDTFVLRTMYNSHNFAIAAAAGVYQSVLGFVIIMSVNGIVKKAQPEYALF